MDKHSILEKAKGRLVIADPFYGTIALETPYVVDRSLNWAATDGVRIFYNPEELEALPLEEVVGVVKHECEHIARFHAFRFNGRDAGNWNTATDAIINSSMRSERNKLPANTIDVPGAHIKFSEEQYYALLPPPKPKGGSGEGGGGGGGQGQKPPPQHNGPYDPGKDPMANDLKRPPPGTKAEDMNEVKGRVARARTVAKAQGKMPADLEAELEELFNPKIGWKERLLQWCNELSDDDVSWARPDRRFVSQGIYLPGKFSDDSMGEFINVYDTSGSMRMEEIGQAMSESVCAINDVTPSKFVAIYCDSKVQHVDEFTEPNSAEVAKSFKRYGAGGTNMAKALDYIDEHYPNAAAVVVFTDGDTPFGEPRAYPVMWGITSERNLESPPFGEVVHVEFDDDEGE